MSKLVISTNDANDVNKYRFWLLAIILLALALRLHNLTYHSLWFDEAMSVYWARQSVPRILEVGFTLVEDRLPPLYYLMLKGWSQLFGLAEWSVRSLSVLFGVLLVPITAGIAARLFNRRVALLTAALIAANPFLVWYAQEARMYAPAVLFGTLAIWAWLHLCPKTAAQHHNAPPPAASSTTTPHPAPPTPYSLLPAPHSSLRLRSGQALIIHHSSFTILFLLSAIAALYSHLYAAFLLPALGLWLIISYPRRWRLWLLFGLAGLLIAAAYAPVALAIWRFSGEAIPGSPLDGLLQRGWWLLSAFTVWQAPLPPTLTTLLPAATLLFALLAYLPKPRIQNPKLKVRLSNQPLLITHPFDFAQDRHSSLITHHSSLTIPHPRLLLTLLLLTPFAIATLLLFRNHLAFFGERYFIVMVPWLLLLAALGADRAGIWLARHLPTPTPLLPPPYASRITHYALRITHYVPFLLLLSLTLLPLPGQWSVPAAKEAWRQSVAYLAEHAASDHAILIHPDWVRHPFQYYFRGPGQTYAAFSTVTAETPLDGPLRGVVGDHPVIWLIQSHTDSPDPERRVEHWFAGRYPLVTELYPPGISLKGFAVDYRLDTLPPGATPVDLRFENGLRLAGYQVEPAASAADPLFHPPSGWLHVTLYWTAAAPVNGEAVPYVHLVGPEGVWGVSLTRANDAFHVYPPARWPADGSLVRHDLDVNLNPVTPPGRYQLLVGIHGLETQVPLTTVEVR